MSNEKRLTIWVPKLVSEHIALENHCCECCGKIRSNILIGSNYFLLSFYRRYLKIHKDKGKLYFVPEFLDPERKLTPEQVKFFIDETLNLRICFSCLMKINAFFDIDLLADEPIDIEKRSYQITKAVAEKEKAIRCRCCDYRLPKDEKFFSKNGRKPVCTNCINILSKVIGYFLS